MNKGKITILGINGHSGHYAAEAFLAAGWTVVGFGRSNKHPIEGVKFIAGDADKVEDMRAAIGDSDVVFHGLNLPYHQWGDGRMEAQMQRIIEATGTAGRTLLFPGTVYVYAASDRVLSPDLRFQPEKSRGEIKVRCEAMLRAATERGDIRAIVLRAGDFFAPESRGDWFEQAILAGAAKRQVTVPGAPGVGHSWAYLPDFAEACVRLAELRNSLAPFESFHFAGHFVTPEQMAAAIQAAAPVPLKQTPFPWTMLKLVGLANPMLRDIVRMRYLWANSMQLRDDRLAAILGHDFGTPFGAAIASTVAPFFAQQAKRAA